MAQPKMPTLAELRTLRRDALARARDGAVSVAELAGQPERDIYAEVVLACGYDPLRAEQ